MQALLNKISGKVFDSDSNYLCGADSYFLQVATGVGVKIFYNKFMRDRNYERFLKYQAIAPKVGAKFETFYGGRNAYGFFVEIVETTDGYKTAKISQLVEDLRDLIDNLGYDRRRMYDMHWGNIGRTFDGRPVVLDFSRFVDDDGFCYINRHDEAYCYDGRDYHTIEVYEDGSWDRLS